MGITGIDHLYVETRSFAKASAFWEGLGFKFAAKWGEDGHKAGMLICGGAKIVLAEASKPCPVTVHFAIEGADAMNVELKKRKGVRVTTPLEDTHWGTRWIRAADPDANVFALEERKNAAKPSAPKKSTRPKAKASAVKKTVKR